MESKSHALAAGCFVLAVLGLLIALAAWLMRDNTATVGYEMRTREAVTGLQEQANVRYKGVAVGKVTGIGFSPDGEVRVRIAVSPDTPVTQSTYATLDMQGVTGLSFVQLNDDGEPGAPLVAGPGGVPLIPLRPGLLGELSDGAGALLARVNTTVERLNQLLSENNTNAISSALADASAAARSLSSLVERSDRLLAAQLDPARTNIPALVREGQAALKSVRAAADQANKTIAELGQVSTEAQQAVRAATAPSGTLSRLNASVDAVSSDTLPRVARLTDDASRALRRLDDVTSQLQSNPQAFLYGNGPIPPGPGEPGFAAAPQ